VRVVSDLTGITILYTANIKGDLGLLPRLATVIRRERQTSTGLTLLLDLGDTCSAEVWVCRATLGRAPLMVLDSIGYDAAIVGGPERAPIPPDALRRLRESTGMLTPIWGRPAKITKRGMTISLVTGAVAELPDAPVIIVDRTQAALPDAGSRHGGRGEVTLGDVPQATVARVDMAWPAWEIRTVREIPVGPEILPDPPTLAVVELVENEARSLLDPDFPL